MGMFMAVNGHTINERVFTVKNFINIKVRGAYGRYIFPGTWN